MSNDQFGIPIEIGKLLASDEAEQITPSMSRIYYRLACAPSEWWDSQDTLCLRGKTEEGVSTTAWAQLVGWLGEEPDTVNKAIQWMEEKEIITYQSNKGGLAIRISLNGFFRES